MGPIIGRFAADFPHGCARMFALASDIERYPDFIPWCRKAAIVARHGDVAEVDNHFGAGPMEAGFRTRALAEPPHRLEITSEDGPFRPRSCGASASGPSCSMGDAGCEFG